GNSGRSEDYSVPCTTKMAVSLYQRGIEVTKHGKTREKTTAVETLMKGIGLCDRFANEGYVQVVKMMAVAETMATTLPYTTMCYIASAISLSS
ncbi:hypothetical protein OQA88_1794, partial [Cercophora sp. LCS_1]